MRWLLLCALVLAGCEREDPPPPLGNLRQPSSAAILVDRLFVGTLPEDGVRVVDLEGRTAGACVDGSDCPANHFCTGAICVLGEDAFVRAPNPLFAVDVPALRQPGVLIPVAATGRPVVVALSEVDPQLRVLDAEALIPLGDPLALPGRPVDAAVGPDGTLLVAVDAPEGETTPGGLVEVRLSDAVRTPGALVTRAPGEVTRIWPVDAVPGGVAFSPASGRDVAWVSDVTAASVVTVDLRASAQTRVDSGVPLGRLLASPAGVEDAGRFVYGLGALGRTWVAFDAEIGAASDPQRFGGEVLPLTLPSRGVAMTAVPDVPVEISTLEDDGTVRVRTPVVPILVLVALIDGRLAYVHGTRMVPVDRDGDFAAVPFLDLVTPAAEDPAAPLVATTVDPEGKVVPRLTLTAGVTRSRTWRLTWRPLVPELAGVSGVIEEDAGAHWFRPSSPPGDLALRAQPGDTVEIDSTSGVPAGCDPPGASYLVVSVTATRLELAEDADPLPGAGCTPVSVAAGVRAGALLVTATGVDLPLRAAPGETLTYPGERFLVTEPLVDGPELSFRLEAAQPSLALGAERVLRIGDGLDPLTLTPAVDVLQVTPAVIPTGLAARKLVEGVPASGRVYVPYAGSGYVLSADLQTRGSQRILR